MSSTPSLGLAPNILPGAHAAGMVAQHSSGALPHKELPGSVVLAHQLPPLKYFTVETQGEGKEIDDWLEQFQMVAEVCRWNVQVRLVNLATRLSGQAYAFYRTCTPQQRTNYDTLITALQNRFTPVRIQSVQSSLFHERKQNKSESIDEYMQEL